MTQPHSASVPSTSGKPQSAPGPVRSIREQLKQLEAVQELDLQVDGLKRDRLAIPAQLKALDAEIERGRVALATKHNLVAEVEKIVRQTRAAIELNEDRAKRATDKLSQVRNGPEYQSAVKEMDQLKRYSTNLAEQLKKAEAELVGARAEVESLTQALEAKRVGRESQAAEFETKSVQFDHQIAELGGRRSTLTVGVDVRVLANYDRVRGARAGLGIVPVVQGRCRGCNMVLAPQFFNQLHKMLEVHTCPSCHRLLFMPEPAAPTGAAPAEGS